MEKRQAVQEIPLKAITESPHNHRRLFGDLSELAQSIRSQGVIQPVTVRPGLKGGFELVVGHRRFRAAAKAELKTIPAIVVEKSDLEVVETQLVENIAREDAHPLEIAEGMADLERRGLSRPQIAARLGLKDSSVFATMKLLDLVPAARKALLQGKLVEHSAVAIARIAGERRQEAALRDVLALGEKATVRRVQELVRGRYMGEKSKTVKRQRAAARAQGADQAIVARMGELLTARVGEQLQRKARLDDSDLRALLVAMSASSEVAADLLAARGVRVDRLSGVRGSALHALLAECLAAAWLAVDATAAQVLARVYRVDLSELESTAQSLLQAEGLFQAP